MLRACVLDWEGKWGQYLPLVEFAYNNSYHASIKMSPYEALYGRPCRTPLCWTEVGERKTVDLAMVEETEEQVALLREKLQEAFSRQKSYADQRRKELEFKVGDEVYLKMRTFRGLDKYRKLKKLKPRYMGPYRILERIGAVAYRLALPVELSDFHDVFHVSVLRKVVREQELIIPTPPEDLRRNLTAIRHPKQILERKEEGGKGWMVRVEWGNDQVKDETWEQEDEMRILYPMLFPGFKANPGTDSSEGGENCNTPGPAKGDKAQKPKAHSDQTLASPPLPYKKRATPPSLGIRKRDSGALLKSLPKRRSQRQPKPSRRRLEATAAAEGARRRR